MAANSVLDSLATSAAPIFADTHALQQIKATNTQNQDNKKESETGEI